MVPLEPGAARPASLGGEERGVGEVGAEVSEVEEDRADVDGQSLPVTGFMEAVIQRLEAGSPSGGSSR